MPAPSLDQLAARAADGFRRAFGPSPSSIAQAPGRINIIGEHTDYQGGLVLPMAIDRWCLCAAAADDARSGLHLAAIDLDKTWSTPTLTRLSAGDADDAPRGTVERGSWASYAAGVVKLVLDAHPAWRPRGIQLAVTSSVPLGAGLSSSAALEVAVATALESLSGHKLDPIAKAKLCQKAEHEFAGVPCGIMDQTIACLAKPGHALLIDCSGAVSTRDVPLPPGPSILVINSGVRHALADDDYARPQQLAADAAERLAKGRLGTIRPHPTSPQVDELGERLALLPEHLRPVARHHFQENARVSAVGNQLLKGNWNGIGESLRASHRSLDENLHVSCPELNTIVAAAAEIPGVRGARMIGGGFGGCAIALVDYQAIESATAHIRARYQSAHHRDCDIFQVQAVGAAGPCLSPSPASSGRGPG